MSTDLTQGSIHRHLLNMALPMMIGMLVQSLYLFVDLYFVSELGPAAIAGVSAAANLMFIVLALTQMLSVGCISLIARATGARNHQFANLVFQQTMLMGFALAIFTCVAGYSLVEFYINTLSADPAVQQAALQYLNWYLPGLALQFLTASIGSALRAVGVVKPTMVVQLSTVLLNILLAPILIAGWGSGVALGVAGAGLASTLSVLAGVILLWLYYHRCEHPVLQTGHAWRLDWSVWRQIFGIGIPAGGEYALMFFFTAFVYWVIQDFGTEVQAAFGIGMRIIQATTMPAIALAFAVPAIAGQNFGAGSAARVKQTFKNGLQQMTVLMLILFVFCQWQASNLVQLFTVDPAVIAAGTILLQIISLNLLSSVLVLICSGMFQALGNTWPVLLSSGFRILVFVLPVLWLSQFSSFQPEMVWWCSAISVLLQGGLSSWLLRQQLRQKLPALTAVV